MYSTHAVCHAATNPMFRSCIVLSSSSTVIENCQCRGRESVSDSIHVSAIEVTTSMWLGLCTHYIDDLLPYEPLCSYWTCGQVFILILICNRNLYFMIAGKIRYGHTRLRYSLNVRHVLHVCIYWVNYLTTLYR